MNAAAPVGGRRAALAFIFITIVLDMFALGMIIPVLPHLIEDFMGGDMDEVLDALAAHFQASLLQTEGGA